MKSNGLKTLLLFLTFFEIFLVVRLPKKLSKLTWGPQLGTGNLDILISKNVRR